MQAKISVITILLKEDYMHQNQENRRREIRNLTTIRKQLITPNMLRVTLLGDFPDNQEGAYVKIVFSGDDLFNDKPKLRTYTIAKQRSEDREIDIDFVIHGEGGLACNWALSTQNGYQIGIGGPDPRKLVDFTADYFIFAADMTALPALAVNLSLLPKNAKGFAVIEIIDAADRQDLVHPENVEIKWVVNPHPGTKPTLLAGNLYLLDNPPANTYVWAACEFSGMKKLRNLFRDEWQIPRDRYYLSSYWKLGAAEDEHRKIKSQDKEGADS